MLKIATTRACDRCHRLKERCFRRAPHDDSCDLCIRLDHKCTTSRTARPRGRPSHAYTLSNTHESCWVQEQVGLGKVSKDRYAKRGVATALPAYSRLSPRILPMPRSISYIPTTRKVVSSGSDRQVSSSPTSTPVLVALENPSALRYASPWSETHLSESLCPSDDILLESMRDREKFLQYFTLGQNFTESFRSLGYARFCEFKQFIHEGSLACAGAVFHARTKRAGFQNIHFARSAMAIRKLRSATVTMYEVAACLTLGLALATFELITSGDYVHSITRFTLSLAHPLYSCIRKDPAIHSQTLSLIFMDTIESLLRGRIPIIQYKGCEDDVVDRLVGLCAPLLPVIHDICRYGHMMRASRMEGRQQSLHAGLDTLGAIVTNWEPRHISAEMETKLSTQEKAYLLGHARAFKTAITLVVHRLQYSFGTEDRKGNMLSAEIFAELGIDLCHESDNGSETMPQTMFPWMIAAFELIEPGIRSRVLSMELPTSREILRLPAARMKETVQRVWRQRDISTPLSLTDALESHLTYILPL